MRVQLMYGDNARTEPGAFLRAGECFQRLSKLASRAGADDRERAITLYNKLVADARYRGTPFGAKAKEHLDELK